MTYLLDSNVWVALLRGTKPQVAARFRAAPSANLRLCSVTGDWERLPEAGIAERGKAALERLARR